MATTSLQKCVHQSCGKMFAATEADDDVCRYHPGPPVFHEGQKGWSCCKPRVLTFDEFLDIPPCTTGKHSTTDVPPKLEKKVLPATLNTAPVEPASGTGTGTGTAIPSSAPVAQAPPREPASVMAAGTVLASSTSASASAPIRSAPSPEPESEDDDPAVDVPDSQPCRRRACGVRYVKSTARNDSESCVHHPGVPIFHEGSKGYSCCKRRVLEFDQFLKIAGCATKSRHLFVGSGGKRHANRGPASGEEEEEEVIENIRHDFYQTTTSVIASFFLKKIDKAAAQVTFHSQELVVDLPTIEGPRRKRWRATLPLFGPINPAASRFKILGTKLEVTLAKAGGAAWPVLRNDERLTGEILQVGSAGLVGQ